MLWYHQAGERGWMVGVGQMDWWAVVACGDGTGDAELEERIAGSRRRGILWDSGKRLALPGNPGERTGEFDFVQSVDL